MEQWQQFQVMTTSNWPMETLCMDSPIVLPIKWIPVFCLHAWLIFADLFT